MKSEIQHEPPLRSAIFAEKLGHEAYRAVASTVSQRNPSPHRAAASRPDPPRIFGTILRQRNTVLHGPFSITVGGSYRVLARAVDGNNHAAGISGTVGCQKDGHIRNFARSGGAPEG